MALDKIGKYTIVARIGQGSTSHVYKAYDPALGRHVALKTISVEANRDATQRSRFVREAQSVALLNHPHIVTLYDFGQERERLYIAMELLEGSDLRQALAERRFRTLEAELEVMTQICEGVAHAHAHGVVHRDLKPANIQILPNGQVKIMDFGLARFVGSDITRTGVVMGTPYYMSPEQVRGEHVDARSDVFALGCLLYELVTGQRAFEADSVHSVLYKVNEARPRPAGEWVPDLPPAILEILARAMARLPADRFADAGAFRRCLAWAREAIRDGRGHERLPVLESILAPAAPTSGAAAVPPAARDESPGARSGSKPRAPGPGRRVAARSATGWPYAIGAFLLLVIAVGAWFFTHLPPGPQGTEAPRSKDAMTAEFVATQIELARKKLETGDYAEAARRAGDALDVDPSNTAARDLRNRAEGLLGARVTASLATTRTALASGDTAKAKASLWQLLELAPEHPEVMEILPALEASFEPEAERARRDMDLASEAASRGAPRRPDSFQEAQARARSGETAFAARRFASAARDFLLARVLYQRALR